ncbi:DUF1150 family protein [Paracoccus sp. (in: a-proteobacteria)]|uniref:DUF1150 family protein n=1 Tax=Paracoccus sp. TaxID=267 RepID=UPI0028A2B7D1|nr:DUF1150 family protein [Paracoccus sp. (in: a-proteobacteria)]
MNTKFEFGKDTDADNTVYIRRVTVASLPQEVQDQAEGLDSLYAVHGADGSRIALVKDRGVAFMLARDNELTPVSVH